MLLKTFIINQRNHLQGMPFFIFEIQRLILIATSACCITVYTRICFVTWYSGPTGFLSSSRPPLSVSPPLYHSNRQRWEGSKTGNDHIFLSCGWKQNSGGAASQDRSSPERRGEKNWEFEKEMVHRTDLVGGFLWVDRPFKFLTDSGKPWRHVYK